MSRAPDQEDASFAAEVMASWQKYYEWERAVVPAGESKQAQNGAAPPPWALNTPPATPERRQPMSEGHIATRAMPRALPPHPEDAVSNHAEFKTRELEAENQAQRARLAVAQAQLEAVKTENRAYLAKVSSQERETKLLQTQLEEQDDVISGLRKQIASLKGTGSESSDLVARTEKENRDLQQKVVQQEAQMKRFQDQAKEMEESRETLERQRKLDAVALEVKDAEITDLRDKLEQATEILDDLVQQVSSLQAARESLDGDSRKAAAELDAKDTQINDLKLQFAAVIRENKQQLARFESINEQQKKEIAALMTKVEDLENQSEQVKAQLASTKAKADELVVKKVSLETEAREQKEESDAKIAALEALANQAGSASQALADSQAKVQTLQQKVSELEGKSRSEEEMEKALTNKIAKLQILLEEAQMGDQINELKNQLESEKSLRLEAIQKQTIAEGLVQALSTEKDELTVSVATMKESEESGRKALQRVQELEKELDSVMKDLDANKAEQRRLEVKSTADALDATVLKAQIDQQRDVIDSLSADLSSLRGSSAQESKERQQLRTEAEKMRAELPSLRSALEKAQEDRMRAEQQRAEAERDADRKIQVMQTQLEEMQVAHNRSVVVATETAAELGGFRQDVEMQVAAHQHEVRTLRSQLTKEEAARRAAEDKLKAMEQTAAVRESRQRENAEEAEMARQKMTVLERELTSQKRLLTEIQNEYHQTPPKQPASGGEAPSTPRWAESPRGAPRPPSAFSVTREATTMRRVPSRGSDDEGNDFEV